MKKNILIINITNLIIDIIAIIVMFIIGAVNNFNKMLFEAFALGLASIAIINVVFMVIKEAKFITYDGKRFLPVLYVAYAIFGIFLHYLMYFVDYYKFIAMYWIIYALGIVIFFIIYLFLQNKYGNKTKNGPKVMINPNHK